MTKMRSLGVALLTVGLVAIVAPAALAVEASELPMAVEASELPMAVEASELPMAVEASEPPVAAEPTGPEGVTWLLDAQVVEGSLAPLPEDVLVSLAMRAGEAGGKGGCNSYFASYELEGETLSFAQIGATMMFCEGPGGEVETVYLDHLASVAAWASDGQTLTLSDEAGTAILEYSAPPAASVVGSWVATGIKDGGTAVVSSEMTSSITAEFGADGSLSGSDGCNSYSTTYTVDGSSITIAPEIVSTRMACLPDEVMTRAERYYTALVASTNWTVDASGSLELRDAEGALQVRFEPAAEAAAG